MSFLSSRTNKCDPEGADQIEVRFNPSPCCHRDKIGHASTSINTKTGLWKCHACGKAGNWFTLTREFGTPIPYEDRFVEPPKVDFSAYNKVRAAMRRPVTGDHHHELLEYCVCERGISTETLNAWRVSSKGAENLRWPIYGWGENGWEIANARLRRVINKEASKYHDWFEVKGGCTELMLGNHLLGLWSEREGDFQPDGDLALPNTHNRRLVDVRVPKRVIIVEGQWDAMTAWQIGFRNVLSLPNGANAVNVSSMLRYVPEDWEVWLAVDMDEQGDKAAELFYSQLGPDKMARIFMPYKDLNEWLMAEPNLTMKQVEETARGWAPSLSPRAEARTQATRMNKFLSISSAAKAGSGSKIVCHTPWNRLTEMLGGGWRECQTTGWLAPSGVGKTTAVNQIGIHAAKSGQKVGLISLEGTRDEVMSKIYEQAMGWTNYKDEAFEEFSERILLSELEGSAVKWEDCMEEFEVMVNAGAKLIIMDNLDYIMPRANSGLASSIKLEAYAHFQEICKVGLVHGICVWQPNKVDSEKIINSGDQKGMAQALQDADNYINMNRVGNLRRLQVEKARSEGVDFDQRYLWLQYDRETSCLYETEHQVGLTLHKNESKPEF